jgi:plasmid stability protein
MATLTVRNLPDPVHDGLRRIAAENRSSVEAVARAALAEHVTRRRSPEEQRRKLKELRAKLPRLPEGAKIDGVDAFLAEKRLDALFEEGLITLEEKRAWQDRLDRHDVSLSEVEALFSRLWPWPKSDT